MILSQIKKYEIIKTFLEQFQLSNVRFENIEIKNLIYDILKKLIK